MPTTVVLPDDASPGEAGHIEDHNTIVDAVAELQTLSNQHLLDSDIVAGSNITVTPGAGNSVTIAATTGSSHTHSTYEAVDADLQDQIDALVTSQSSPISLTRLPAGSLIVVDKAKTESGHAAGAWPTVRPTGRTDVTVMFKGNSDPALTDPSPVLPQDIWFQTP